jgi:hypothetical protein
MVSRELPDEPPALEKRSRGPVGLVTAGTFAWLWPR